MPLLLLMFCTVTSCYTFRYTVTYHCHIPTHSQYNGTIKVTHSKVTMHEINIAALYDLLVGLIVVH